MLSRKNKNWKPEILEQIMLAAASGEAEGLVELTLKIVALAAGFGMPKPKELLFTEVITVNLPLDREAKFEWASGNGRTLSIWLQTNGKIRFQSGMEDDGELVEDAPIVFVTHIFCAWTAA